MCLSIAVKRPDQVLNSGFHREYQWTVTSNGLGYRCGYVRIPQGHPFHGKHYQSLDIQVHGGLTFSEADVACDAPGEDSSWWVGFDCAHVGDAPDPKLAPRRAIDPLEEYFLAGESSTVRTQEYVEAECRSICEQVEAARISHE